MTQRFLRNRGLSLSATALLFIALSLSSLAGVGMPWPKSWSRLMCTALPSTVQI